MKIEVRSRTLAKKFECDEPWAAISVCSYDGDWPELPTENRVALLQLAFKDIEFPGRSGGITPEQAKQILDFVGSIQEQIQVLLVHCEHGQSRSPAIAAAVTEIFNHQPNTEFFDYSKYVPNLMVYEAILDAAKES